jgi:hypothetical protein
MVDVDDSEPRCCRCDRPIGHLYITSAGAFCDICSEQFFDLLEGAPSDDELPL